MDFELEIEWAGDRYRAKVRKAPVDLDAKCWSDLPAGADLEEISLNPENLSARDLGRRLFEMVFAGPVLDAWRASDAVARNDLLLRLRLEDDPRLLSLPWELLFDSRQGSFIAIEKRFVRTLDLLAKAKPLSGWPSLRVLAVLSCPPNVEPLEIEREWNVLQETLGRGVKLRRVEPRLDEVDRALRSGKWHVLHFVGHGGMDEKGGYLVLEGRQGDARHVDHLYAGTFLSHPSLRLVALNACECARPGQSDAFSGVAHALVRSGVPAVVAMQQPISDRVAIEFSRAFYGGIARNATVGAALQRARKDLFRDEEAEWAVPVLYLNGPDDRLLRSIGTQIAAIAAGILLLGLLGFASWRRPTPEPPPSSCKLPRGAGQNPPECPSPPGLNMALVKIKPGTFEMGDAGTQESRPVHRVTITRPFCIGVYEVTQEQWARVLGSPRPREEDRYLPAHGIRYDSAQSFVRLLNEKDPARPSRLPTEAEWEYVARGKTQMIYSFLDDPAALVRHANCGEIGDGFEGPACVGQFPPNLWGAHDMYGNVSEWVSDRYGVYSGDPVKDPSGPIEGNKRIRRGGSWKSGANACTSANRSAVQPNRRDRENGFRIVREIPPS